MAGHQRDPLKVWKDPFGAAPAPPHLPFLPVISHKGVGFLCLIYLGFHGTSTLVWMFPKNSTLASFMQLSIANHRFVNLSKNWGEEAAMQISAWGLGLIHILHIIYIHTDAVSAYQYIFSRSKTVAFTQKRVNAQDESWPIRVLFLPMILSHATKSIWSSRCWA